ncbi:alpha/beta hydrolase [Streptomyces sp. enrichment culture]|uniref:alpha/beta hydrolase n=1 Tax=Streptomyces sp. enrichment culture TaxID=1795815 RepID=UPI003F542BD1
MDLTTLKTFRPAEYEDAADAYRATGDIAGTAKDTIDQQVSAALRDRLEGEAATAALVQLKHLSRNFHYAQTGCGLVSTALNGFAHDMGAARRKLMAALEDARAAGCTVGADGSVTYPAGGDAPEGGTVRGTDGPASPMAAALYRQSAAAHPNPHHGRALELAQRIADALAEAAEADARWAPRLRALRADDDLTVSHADWKDAHTDRSGLRAAAGDYLASLPQRPRGGTPQDNAAWWQGLTAEQRSAWLSLHPALVGAMDGLPAAVRDEANRVVLNEHLARTRLALDAVPEPPANRWTWTTTGLTPTRTPTPEYLAWQREHGERYLALQNALKGMETIQRRFDQTGERGLPEAYLLGFDPEGNGRAIIATGNPDTAHHQAVYVPGTTSNLSSFGEGIDRMTNLWRVAEDKAGGQAVSTITWLGYDAPQHVVTDAPLSHYADDGAPAFNRFMDGLEASHAGETPAHRTAIGHSYGTTLIGSAARQGHLNADEIVFAGSPGVQVPKAEQMDVPADQVWNLEADGDVVPDIGRFGHGGRDSDGPWAIPSDERFGANQMATGAIEGHSQYWKERSASLVNQGLVVAGRGDDVKLEE